MNSNLHILPPLACALLCDQSLIQIPLQVSVEQTLPTLLYLFLHGYVHQNTRNVCKNLRKAINMILELIHARLCNNLPPCFGIMS